MAIEGMEATALSIRIGKGASIPVKDDASGMALPQRNWHAQRHGAQLLHKASTRLPFLGQVGAELSCWVQEQSTQTEQEGQ